MKLISVFMVEDGTCTERGSVLSPLSEWVCSFVGDVRETLHKKSKGAGYCSWQKAVAFIAQLAAEACDLLRLARRDLVPADDTVLRPGQHHAVRRITTPGRNPHGG